MSLKVPPKPSFAATGTGSNQVVTEEIVRNRALGYVVACDGAEATVATVGGFQGETADYWTVGRMISIQVGEHRVVGLLKHILADDGTWRPESTNGMTLRIELVGEVRPAQNEGFYFSTGISNYPHLGAIAHGIRSDDLRAMYRASAKSAIRLGVLSQNEEIPAKICVDSLLTRHFAVVGTTGTGKSTAVALMLHLIADAKPKQRILILDPHNEYDNAFPGKAHSVTVDTLDLPFWLLNLEEFSRVVFRGRNGAEDELDALREFIPRAKLLYKTGRLKGIRRGSTNSGFTADTPVPYRIADLLNLIEEEIGSLDGAIRRLTLRRLKSRLENVMNDPRFHFLFNSNKASDRINEVLGDIYRVPLNGKQITVFQMSGIPSEVVDSIACVLCRLAFDIALASQSQVKTLVVCEEAHRYIPVDTGSGFAPTRGAIARIAKEGRKYGVSLAIITQRPNELDPTILSQCNTIFALRLGNDADQDVMRKAIANSSRSALAFLSSLADRECIAFGSAVTTAMRMKFRNVPAKLRPASQHVSEDLAAKPNQEYNLTQIVSSLRGNDIDTSDEETDEWLDESIEPVETDEVVDKSDTSQIELKTIRSTLLRKRL